MFVDISVGFCFYRRAMIPGIFFSIEYDTHIAIILKKKIEMDLKCIIQYPGTSN